MVRENWLTNAWVNNYKNTLTFDINGNWLSIIEEFWSNNVWNNHWNYSYTYDSNGNSITGKAEKWQSNNWSFGIDDLYVFSNKEIVYYVSCYRYTINFTSFNTDIFNAENQIETVVFPNPTKNVINIINTLNECNDFIVSIYNSQGHLINQKLYDEKNIIIDINNFANGIYFIKMGNQNNNKLIKLIKE